MRYISKQSKLKKRINKWLTFFSKPFIRFLLIVCTCLVSLVAYIMLYNIDPSEKSIMPSCSLHFFTGLYCPGCGMTRALHAALHLRFIDAFSYNLLWPFIILFVLGAFYIWLYFLITGKDPFVPFNSFFKKHSYSGWVAIILLFAFWILRNIPIYPFTLLTP